VRFQCFISILNYYLVIVTHRWRDMRDIAVQLYTLLSCSTQMFPYRLNFKIFGYRQ
jgi:hypothetical protein